jgi:hypothetical protein
VPIFSDTTAKGLDSLGKLNTKVGSVATAVENINRIMIDDVKGKFNSRGTLADTYLFRRRRT